MTRNRRHSIWASCDDAPNTGEDGGKVSGATEEEEKGAEDGGNGDEHEEEEDKGKDKEPTIDEWLEDAEESFEELKSFHRLYVSEDKEQVYLRALVSEFSKPFFNQLTFIGAEGNLPDMIDCTPYSTGFQLRMAPNGNDVLLVAMQQRLVETDLAASLYDSETGGALQGHIFTFEPVAVTKDGAAKAEVEDEKSARQTDSGSCNPQCTDEGQKSKSCESTFGHLDAESAKFCVSKKSGISAGECGAGIPQVDKSMHLATKENVTGEIPGHDEENSAAANNMGENASSSQILNDEASIVEVLLDITDWLGAFANEAMEAVPPSHPGAGFGFGAPRPRAGPAKLIEARGFPQNFYLRFMTQGSSGKPVKNAADRTIYYSVAFCELPADPMIPRAKDRRVGFFETRIIVGGANKVNEEYSVINKWNLPRRGGKIVYCIDPDVPALYHDTIKKGVESWNTAFCKAGCGENVVICLSPKDEGFPGDYARGDARFNAIYLTDPAIPVYGFGPSLTDFRSGEILVSHVLLGFSAFTHGASMHNLKELLGGQEKTTVGIGETKVDKYLRQTAGCRTPLLDADHPDVLNNLLSTVVHEVGHTLGLRHNFIAQEDGNTSAMCYADDVDTSMYIDCFCVDQAEKRPPAKYGGHYLYKPGRYDEYAIKYGYMPLRNEVWGRRHRELDRLANGEDVSKADDMLQSASQIVVPRLPKNPLFATDEDVGLADPRVNRWNRNVRRCGHDKFVYALVLRKQLLAKAEAGTIFPQMFARRVTSALDVAARHVMNATRLIGGSYIDATRTSASPCSVSDARNAIKGVVDYCVGPAFRFSSDEAKYMIPSYTDEGYRVQPTQILRQHSKVSTKLISLVLSQSKLESVELSSAHATTSTPKTTHQASLRTLDIIEALAFDPGKLSEYGIFYPFMRRNDSSSTISLHDLNMVGRDALRTHASLELARLVNAIVNSQRAHALVKSGAAAFVESTCKSIREFIDSHNNSANLDPAARLHWLGVVAQLEKKPEPQSGSGSMSLASLFGGDLPSKDALAKLDEEENFQLFHAGCDHMRCRHDPQRSLRSRIDYRRTRRLLKTVNALHMAQRKATAYDVARL